MNKTMKVVLFSILVLAVLLIIPNISNAATPIIDEDSLISAIDEATSGTTITLNDNIELSNPILIDGKTITIDGNGFKVEAASTWTSTSGNQTMFTSSNTGTKLTLKNITLQGGPKYGVQAYNGGAVVLNGVTINNCGFGGVLINGGTVTINNLSLGFNGTSANNGIEMDQGSNIQTEPVLVMDGTLSTTQSKNVVRVLSTSNITNTETTKSKVFVSGNSVILADANNNIVAEGAVEGGAVNEEVQKVILTVIAGNMKKEVVIDKDSTITKAMIESYIKLADNEVVDGYYTDDTYSVEFNFDTVISEDTTIYAKVSTVSNEEEQQTTVKEGEKDETPKTGVENYVGIAAGVVVLATIAIITLKRKNA